MLFPEDDIAKSASNGDSNRLTSSYTNTSDRFRFKGQNDYSKQFAHIYASRLTEMRELLTQKVKVKWGNVANKPIIIPLR